MSVMEREQLIKLHILTSLARSQRALSKMLEAMSHICAESEETARRLAEHVDIISKYQQTLTTKITGMSIRQKKKGSPQKPWLRPDLTTSGLPFMLPETARGKANGFENKQQPAETE